MSKKSPKTLATLSQSGADWGHDSCPSTGAQLGVMILVLVLEHNSSTLEELEDQVITKKEVVLIHNVCYLILTISSISLVNKLIHIYVYGAKYQFTNGIVPNSFDTEVPCYMYLQELHSI